MIALFLIPLFFAITAYLYSWLIRWLSAISPFFRKKPVMIITGIIIFLFNSLIYVSYLLPPGETGRSLKQLGYYWMAIVLYFTMSILVADLIRIIIRRVRKNKGGFSRKVKIMAGLLCLVISASALVYGFINARLVRTTVYDIDVEKEAEGFDELNVVLVADLHMGFNVGCSHIQDMTDAINALDPDIVVVAGDIFDNEYDALDDDRQLISILKTIRSRYGVYCVYGNHDIDEKLLTGFTFNFKGEKISDPRMDSFIEDCGWKRLTDEGVMIGDSIYLFGRPDYKKPGKGVTQRLTPDEITKDLDPAMPVILLEHEPVELDELAAAGVDVELAGHTHAGQFFPMNITNGIIWKNGYGMLDINGMKSIVTSGVGVYGSYFRTCTISEVVQVNIYFRNK